MTSLRGPFRRRKRKINSADDDGEHVVEVVRDAAGQLADRFHLLHLAELGFGGFALHRFGFQRLVRLPQLLRAFAHRLLELPGTLGFALGLAAGRRVLAQRLDGDHAEEDRAEANDDAKPAQIVGELVGLGGEELALLDAPGPRLPLGADDVLELVVEQPPGTRVSRLIARRGIEIADTRIALLRQRRAGREGKLARALVVQRFGVINAAKLLRAFAFEPLELLDLVAGELPVAGVDVAVRIDFLVEHEPREGGLGARDVGADIADDQGDLIGLALGGERLLARVVREFDEEHHADQEQGRNEPRGRSAAAPPVEPDVLPIVHHEPNVTALTFWGNPR